MTPREATVAAARAELGLREDAGPNADKAGKIASWLKACGVGPALAWCAAFASMCLRAAGLKVACAGACNLGRMWPAVPAGEDPMLGDLLWYPTDEQGHGHVGIVIAVGPVFVVTIEGNQRNGVRMVRRLRKDCRFTRVPLPPQAAPLADVSVEFVVTAKVTTGTR
jgi:hypothetical protein